MVRNLFAIVLLLVSTPGFAAQVNEDVYSPSRVDTEVEIYRHDFVAVIRGDAAEKLFDTMKAPEQWGQGKYIKPHVTKTVDNLTCEKPMNGAEVVCSIKLSK